MLATNLLIAVFCTVATSTPTGQDIQSNLLVRQYVCRSDDCGVGQQCGGIAAFPCPPGLNCVDNPNDNCNPRKGGADCSGICVKPAACGGFGAIPCPKGLKCVDDPSDDCDPKHGGADCIGICV